MATISRTPYNQIATRTRINQNVPQNVPMPGEKQVANNAGGFVYQITPWQQLNRFIILGTVGGTYYTGEKKLTKDNVTNLENLIKENGVRFVNTVVELAQRAPKSDPALFALAYALSVGDAETKRLIVKRLPEVARTGTMLFAFVEFAQQFRGWGRALRDAVSTWYLTKTPQTLSYQVAKYQQRNGWSHKDLLRLAHTKPSKAEQQQIFQWIVKGETPKWQGTMDDPLGYPTEFKTIVGFEEAKRAENAKEIVRLIQAYDLPRECIPTQFLKDRDVWEALLYKMPLMAMIRNLAVMSRVGLLVPMSEASQQVVRALTNPLHVQKSRVHPIDILSALRVYSNGRGVRSRGEAFEPISQISDALNEAFYLSFGNVEATGKRTLLALDVSGSMSGGEIAGIPGLTPREAASAMAMVTARSEWSHGTVSYPLYHSVAFGSTLKPIPLSPTDKLQNVMATLSQWDGGRTDCSQPMVYAKNKKIAVDTFICYTDNETWAGQVHASQALDQYRQATGIPAKLIVVAFTSTQFSIARPGDAGMLDVVGFDSAAPSLISSFSKGEIS